MAADFFKQALDGELLGRLRELREGLHRRPELAFQEKHTAQAVADFLQREGIAVVARGVAGTGVVGLIESGRPGPCVALRADMDALPIQEESDLPYRSEVAGAMHACGHDGHVAAVLGAGALLKRARDNLHGNIKLVFQPAEEDGNGALRMVEAGVLENPKVDAVLALHARPPLPVGMAQVCLAPAAATCPFRIVVEGRGGHAAYPHLAADPITAGAQLVVALQQIVSRQVPPFEPAVVTVGSFKAGERGNVIPQRAELLGTIRSRSSPLMAQMKESLERMVEGVARSLGLGARVEFAEGTPALHNTPALVDLVERAAREMLGQDKVIRAEENTMGGEDFAYYLTGAKAVPGCLFWLGVDCPEPLHTSRFDFGQQAVGPGALVLARSAEMLLEERG